MSSPFFAVPTDILVHIIVPFLKSAESNEFLGCSKKWLAHLLQTRTVSLGSEQWNRFCNDERYRKRVLTLVGCIDPVSKQEVPHKKLKLLLEGLMWYGYREVIKSQLTQYAKFIRSFDFEFQSKNDIVSESTLGDIEGLPILRKRTYNVSLGHLDHLMLLLKLATVNETGVVAANLSDIVANAHIHRETSFNQQHGDSSLWVKHKLLLLAASGICSVVYSSNDTVHFCTKPFAHLSKVEFHMIDSLVDVSPLEGISVVKISYCRNLVDISPLNKADTVVIVGCSEVTNLEILKEVPSVKLVQLPQLLNVDCFAHCRTTSLSVIKCGSLEDISMLGMMQHLDIQSCEKIARYPTPISTAGNDTTDKLQRWKFRDQGISALTEFGNLLSCELESCRNISTASLRELREVPRLILSRGMQVSDVSCLAAVIELSLYCCHLVERIDGLLHLEDLRINRCNKLSSVTNLPNLKWLTIRGCSCLETIANVDSLRGADIDSCDKFADVEGLKHAKYVGLPYCKGIVDVSALEKVEILNLDCCSNVTSIEGMHNLFGRHVPPQFQSADAKWFFQGPDA
jgi:hypothetical protein